LQGAPALKGPKKPVHPDPLRFFTSSPGTSSLGAPIPPSSGSAALHSGRGCRLLFPARLPLGAPTTATRKNQLLVSRAFRFRCRCNRRRPLSVECASWQGLPADTPLMWIAYFKPPQSHMSKPMSFVRQLIIRPPRGQICGRTRRLQRLPRKKAPAPPPIKDMHASGFVKPLRKAFGLDKPSVVQDCSAYRSCG